MLEPNWLGRLAGYHPDRKALCFQGAWSTYGDLYRRVRRTAGTLWDLGVRKGDRVGLLAWNHPVYLDLLFAGPLLGHILTPFNHRLSLAELRTLYDYAEPRVLFYGEGFQEMAQALDPKALPSRSFRRGRKPRRKRRWTWKTPPSSSSPGAPPACPRGR